MPYFSISDHPKLPVTVARVTDRRPKPVDKDGFRLRYVAETPEDPTGAEIALNRLDESFGSKCKAPGVYQASYEEVRQVFQAVLDEAPKPPRPPLVLKILAGCGIAVCFAWSALVGPWAIIGWIVICMFKKQSGLLTMGETAVVWSIFDTRLLVTRLWRYIRS